MKKFFLVFAVFLLTSCNQSQPMQEMPSEQPESSGATMVITPSEELTTGENEQLQKYLQEYEAILRADGRFSEEIIKQALDQKRSKWIEDITKTQ